MMEDTFEIPTEELVEESFEIPESDIVKKKDSGLNSPTTNASSQDASPSSESSLKPITLSEESLQRGVEKQDVLKPVEEKLDVETHLQKIQKLRSKQLDLKHTISQQSNIATVSKAMDEEKKINEEANKLSDEYARAYGYSGSKLGYLESFLNSAQNTVNSMNFGIRYMHSTPENQAKMLKENFEKQQTLAGVIQPKEGFLGEGAQIFGGISPFVGIGFASGGFGELPALVAGAASFGLSEVGLQAQHGYDKAKEQGLSDEEAAKIGHTDAISGGGMGTLAGGILHGIGGKEIPKSFMDWMGKTAKKNAGIGAIFSSMQLAQNAINQQQGLDIELGEGVLEKGLEGAMIGIAMDGLHKMGNSMTTEERGKIQDAIAYTNPQAAITGVSKAQEAGILTPVEASNLIEPIVQKASVFKQLPDVPFEEAVEVAPHVEKIDNLNKQLETATPVLKPNIEDAIVRETMVLNEKLGTPLTLKEQTEYEKLVEKREKTDGEGKKTPLLDSEKERIKHFEKRIKAVEERKIIEKENAKLKEEQEKKNEIELEPTITEPKTDLTEDIKQTVSDFDKQNAEMAESIIPTEEVKVETPVEKDYKVTKEETIMPDGEKGVKVTIEKPNGEKVELEPMYPEDVEREVAKKIRGFKLAETEKPKAEAVEETKQDLTGEEITFEQAGRERTGKVSSIDKDGNYVVVINNGKRDITYHVKPQDARKTESIEQAKKSLDTNLKKIDEMMRNPKKDNPKPPTMNAIVPKDVITAPMKLLSFGDKLLSSVTSKIEDGIARAYQKATGTSNKYISRASSQLSGLFRQIGLTQKDIEERRKSIGQMNSAPLKAVKFYENAVNIVGRTPESLSNVHQVLDPEVYTKTGVTPKTEADLSPAEKQLYDLLRATNDAIHEWHYVNGRISQETYNKNKGKYAPRFYDNIEFELPKELERAFEDYGKTTNFSYVKERQAFEDVMNENVITQDPVYGTSMRLAQMLRNQAVLDYANLINSKTKIYSEGDANIPNSYVKLEGGGQYGNINIYGKLTNKYVPREVAEDFKGYMFLNHAVNKLYDFNKWYNRTLPRQILNKTKTIYNPITQLGNIGSNYVFALMNGIDPLTYQNRKIEAAKEVREKGDVYAKLVEEGILGTDITTSDIREAARPTEGGKNILQKADEAISEFYGSRDDIAKVAAYLSHTKDYGRSESEALKRVSEGFQNYNNVGRFYDFASKTPVIGNPFVKFKGDLLRIMKNNFSQRPLTNIALLVGLNAIVSTASQLSDEDEKVREARERRKFIPKVPLPDVLGGDIPLVWQTPYGEINAARYFSPFNIYDMGERGSTVEEVSQFLPVQLKNYEETSVPLPAISDPFLGVYAQVAFDKDFRGKPILDPEENKYREGNATKEEKIQNALTFIARQQIPFFANADDMLRSYNGEPDYYGRNKDLKQSILNNIIKIQTFDKPEVIENLKQEIDGRMRDLDNLNKDITSARNLAEKNIRKINGRQISEEKKQIQIKQEYERAQNKITEILNKQVEIKQKLLEPKEILKGIGGGDYSGRSTNKPKTLKTF